MIDSPRAVPREQTQAEMDKLAAATMRHTPSQSYTVADRLEERARTCGDRSFLCFGRARLGYAALNASANRVAHYAHGAGLQRGDVAALMMENRPEFVATWAGMAKLGVTTSLLNTNVRGRALGRVIEASDAKLVVCGSECLDHLMTAGDDVLARRRVVISNDPRDDSSSDGEEQGSPAPHARATLTFPGLDEQLARMPIHDPDRALRAGLVAGDDLFHVFTSGTTGLPKAARLSHMRYLGVGDGMSAIAGYGPDDVIAAVLPLYHGAAGMVVVSCALAQGATVALRRRFSATRFWDDARRQGTTAVQYIGEICRYLLAQPARADDRDHSIRVMMGAGLGGDIWAAFQERFGIERILEGWSSTEANTNLINLDNKVGSCGRVPFKERHNGRLIRYDVETDSHPRDRNGFYVECAAGEVGEFVGMIPNLPDSGAGRFEGYTSREETDKKVLHDVFAHGDAWYRSGDLLRADEDGYYYFVDRIGDTYRWKSENVSTQEVAEALGGFPGLEIANVYGVTVAGNEGRAGMAALVLRHPAGFDGRAFYAFTSERLPSYAAPLFVRLADQPDLTTTFKLRKVDLQRDGYDPARVSDPLYVRDDGAGAYVPLTKENLPG